MIDGEVGTTVSSLFKQKNIVKKLRWGFVKDIRMIMPLRTEAQA